ncbi:MAG: tetratricopeptide repeat protein [Saccharospirillum sp.]|nr:tetratricopeptide repeat protein [Saccharospirillum sp.]
MKARTQLLTSLVATLGILVLAGCNSSNAESEAAEHLQRAQVYTDQGQYRSALIEIRNATQKDPGNINHAIVLAEVYLMVGASSFAVETLMPWEEEAPEAIALPLAEAYNLQGKFVSAQEALQAFNSTDTADRVRRDRIAADSTRLAGNYSLAIDRYRNVLDTDPANKEAARGLANALIRSEQATDAEQFINTWMAEHQPDAELLYLKGLVQYQFNELDTAAETLTGALEQIPTSDTFLPIRRQVLTLLSRTSTELGQITQAQIYNQILAENTNQDLQQGTQTALAAIAEGDLATARSTLETLMRQNPDNNLVGMLLGAVSLQMGDIEQGDEMLSSSLDAETSPTPFIQLSAMAQVDRGQREQAMTTLERALLARPTDVDLLAMHGVLAIAEPATASAGLASLAKALEIDNSRSRLRLALAQHHLRNNETEQALAQLRSAYNQNPTDWPVTDFYLSVLLNNSLNTEARELRDGLLANHADEPFANLLVAMADHQFGETDRAISRLERLVQNSNANWNAPRLALASLYQTAGRSNDAIQQYLQAAEQEPTVLTPLQQAARLYAANNSTEELFNWLENMGDNYPQIAINAHALLASLQLQRGNLDDARATLNRHTLDSNDYIRAVNAQVLVAEAQQAMQQDNTSLARSKLAEAISLQPENVAYHLMLVRTTAAAGNLPEAKNLLEQVSTDFGAVAPVVVTRSQLIEQEEGASNAYNFLRAEWADQPQPGLASELIRLARQVAPDDIITHARQWTEVQPDSPQAWQMLGDLYLGQANEASAEQAYREVLRFQPNNVAALNNLAWVLRDAPNEEAVALANRAANLAPENPNVLDTYGWVLHKAGYHQEAIEILEQALALDPNNPDIQQHLTEAQAAR